jgi:hypothetical protein
MQSTMILAGSLLALAAHATRGHAQSLQVGERVRLTPTGTFPTALTGTLTDIRGDTLFVAQDSAATDVRWMVTSTLSRIERGAGRRSRWLEGALWGGLAGSAVGAIAGYASYEEPEPFRGTCDPAGFFCPGMFDLDFGRGFHVMAGAVVGSIAGAVVGTIVGSTKSTDRWRRVTPLSESVGLRAGPTARGASAGFSIAFGAPPGN